MVRRPFWKRKMAKEEEIVCTRTSKRKSMLWQRLADHSGQSVQLRKQSSMVVRATQATKMGLKLNSLKKQ